MPNPLEIPAQDRARVASWERVATKNAKAAGVLLSFGFGIAMPLVCLIVDPGLFHNASDNVGPLSWMNPSVYAFAAIEMIVLAVWLASRRPNGIVSGILASGAVLSVVVAITFLPGAIEFGSAAFSDRKGAFWLVPCAFALSPWATALVYGCNARLAFRGVERSRRGSPSAFALGFGAMLVLTFALQWLAGDTKL